MARKAGPHRVGDDEEEETRRKIEESIRENRELLERLAEL